MDRGAQVNQRQHHPGTGPPLEWVEEPVWASVGAGWGHRAGTNTVPNPEPGHGAQTPLQCSAEILPPWIAALPLPTSTASHPPGKPHQRQLRTDRQTDRQLSKTHPWLPSAPARARAPLSAGKHGQGPAGARSLAPPCPRRQEPWERKARTKMTFLLIRAIKNKVERGRSRLPTLPSSSAPAPKPSPAAGESPARACAGTAGEPSPAGSWHSGHIPHVQHFLLAFVIPQRPHSRWEGRGETRGVPCRPLGIITPLH